MSPAPDQVNSTNEFFFVLEGPVPTDNCILNHEARATLKTFRFRSPTSSLHQNIRQ